MQWLGYYQRNRERRRKYDIAFEEESRLFYLYVPETGTKGNDYD